LFPLPLLYIFSALTPWVVRRFWGVHAKGDTQTTSSHENSFRRRTIKLFRELVRQLSTPKPFFAKSIALRAYSRNKFTCHQSLTRILDV
jgi:hypothetical protein